MKNSHFFSWEPAPLGFGIDNHFSKGYSEKFAKLESEISSILDKRYYADFNSMTDDYHIFVDLFNSYDSKNIETCLINSRLLWIVNHHSAGMKVFLDGFCHYYATGGYYKEGEKEMLENLRNNRLEKFENLFKKIEEWRKGAFVTSMCFWILRGELFVEVFIAGGKRETFSEDVGDDFKLFNIDKAHEKRGDEVCDEKPNNVLFTWIRLFELLDEYAEQSLIIADNPNNLDEFGLEGRLLFWKMLESKMEEYGYDKLSQWPRLSEKMRRLNSYVKYKLENRTPKKKEFDPDCYFYGAEGPNGQLDCGFEAFPDFCIKELLENGIISMSEAQKRDMYKTDFNLGVYGFSWIPCSVDRARELGVSEELIEARLKKFAGGGDNDALLFDNGNLPR